MAYPVPFWRESIDLERLCGRAAIFNSADLGIITKCDLVDAVEFDEAAGERNIRAARPDMEASSSRPKQGRSMREFLNFIESRRTILPRGCRGAK